MITVENLRTKAMGMTKKMLEGLRVKVMRSKMKTELKSLRSLSLEMKSLQREV
jgi:hypothetical protein